MTKTKPLGASAEEHARLAALYQVSQALGASLNLDATLRIVMDSAVRLTRAERGFLMLFEAGGTLVFRLARDAHGERVDPDTQSRVVSTEGAEWARNYVERRFPALKDAPIVETRVCQYEQTPDSQFIVDRHPAMENVWLVGGGSGHGFKHGPAIGEMMAGVILKGGELKAGWRLGRFQKNTSSPQRAH